MILFEPYYGYHASTLLAVEAVPKYVTMHPPDWTFDPKELERVVTPKTRGILINTPANPSGKVFTMAELEQIAEFAIRHDLFVFTDEARARTMCLPMCPACLVRQGVRFDSLLTVNRFQIMIIRNL